MLELRKDIFADERDDNLKEIGKGTQRQDMLGHVTGTSTYFDDHKLQGMLHLKTVRSTHSHARLRRIDTTDAERSPGVRRIIRGADVPRNLNTLLSLINFGKDDEPSLAVDKVRYKGEPIVAIVADSPREAYEAMAKVRIDYEPLPAVFDVEDALKPRAPGALFVRARGRDAIRSTAGRRAHLHQGRRDARWTDRGAQDPRLLRQRRLYQALELCGRQMRGAPSGPLHHPKRLWRRLLRVHQPDTGDGHARLRRYRHGLCDRVPDGQAGASRRHGPDGVPHPQRLSRRRHEGAP